MFRHLLKLVLAMTFAVAVPVYPQFPNPLPWPTPSYADLSFVNEPTITVNEASGVATFKVKRTGDMTSSVSVQVTSEFWNGSSGPMPLGTPSVATLSFGPNETLETFTVPILDDGLWSGERSASVVLRNPSANATIHGSTTNPWWIVVQVQEDEPVPSVSVANVLLPETNSGRRNGVFVLKISPPPAPNPNRTWYVPYQFVDGTGRWGVDYTAAQYGSVYFDTDHTEKMVPFEIIGDTTLEPNETFKLHFPDGFESLLPRVGLPPDATCTILNDDTDLTPGTASVARGQSVKFLLDIGLPAASALDVILRASEASVVSVPASIHFNPGQSVASFAVTGSTPGASRISLTLPVEHGGQTLSSVVTVHDIGMALFEPNHATALIGEETMIRVSLQPASTQTERLPLKIGNGALAGVPAEVIVPPGGNGEFTIKGIAPGATYVQAQLPPLFGNQLVTLLVDVTAKAPTPAIIGIEPASGSATGGTPFVATGSLLTADCTLLFGDAPAQKLALTSTGMLIGATPAHASGPVDVTLACGSNTFILTNAFTYAGTPRTRSVRH